MSKKECLKTVQHAIDYIECNLELGLNTAQVAANVGFSEFYFHRIFVNTTGESVTAYQRRRRLTKAAQDLRNTRRSVLEISIEAGFESQESFTRSFKTLFGVTPGKYRKEKILSPLEKNKLSVESLFHYQEGLNMEAKFVKFEGAEVMGIAGSFHQDTAPIEIPYLWNEFVGICRDLKLPTQNAFGVCICEHPLVKKINSEQFVYISSIPILGKKENIPANLLTFSIPAGNYAVFTHKGHMKDFHHTVKYIWSTWVPENKQIFRDGPDFELYDERFDPISASGEVDIYVPVK